MHIAVFGGAFDPPHLGHLHVAQVLLEKNHADEVWFMPVNDHPFAKKMSPGCVRVAMLELMIEPRMKIELLELESPGMSYSFHSLCTLKKRYPQHSFSFVIGADNVATFTKWHDYAALLEEFTVWVYPRMGSSLEQVLPGMQILTAVQPVNISSTQAREALQTGRSVAGLLSERVANYCRETKLYTKYG